MPMTAKLAAALYRERCLVANQPYSFITKAEKQEIIKSLPYLRQGKFVYPKKISKELAEKIIKLDEKYTNKEIASLLLSKDDDANTGSLIVRAAEKTINGK
jgi:hypothetical protein